MRAGSPGRDGTSTVRAVALSWSQTCVRLLLEAVSDKPELETDLVSFNYHMLVGKAGWCLRSTYLAIRSGDTSNSSRSRGRAVVAAQSRFRIAVKSHKLPVRDACLQMPSRAQRRAQSVGWSIPLTRLELILEGGNLRAPAYWQ